MDGPGHRPSLPTVLRPSSFARRRGVVAGPPPQQLGSLLTLPQVGDHGIVDSSLESKIGVRMFAFDQLLREGLSSFDPIV